jgi:hypothetical protein
MIIHDWFYFITIFINVYLYVFSEFIKQREREGTTVGNARESLSQRAIKARFETFADIGITARPARPRPARPPDIRKAENIR